MNMKIRDSRIIQLLVELEIMEFVPAKENGVSGEDAFWFKEKLGNFHLPDGLPRDGSMLEADEEIWNEEEVVIKLISCIGYYAACIMRSFIGLILESRGIKYDDTALGAAIADMYIHYDWDGFKYLNSFEKLLSEQSSSLYHGKGDSPVLTLLSLVKDKKKNKE